MLRKVISGGQTGADQGGLLAAVSLGVPTGGTCPANWETSHGPNMLLSALGLVPKGTLKSRTIDNIRDSDGTVVLTLDASSAGSVLTVKNCKVSNKPVLEIDLNTTQDVDGFSAASYKLAQFVVDHEIEVLNVAGNRERDSQFLCTKLTQSLVKRALTILIMDGDCISI